MEPPETRKWPHGLSVVLPAFDEIESIRFSVLTAHAILSELVETFEIIVVSDGSTDGTDAEVERLIPRVPHLRLVRKIANEGYGFALRDGFRAARHPFLFFTDADRQFDLVSLQDLLPHAERHDIVVGYRKHRQDTAMRRFLSFGYNVVVRALFDLAVRDVDCAFKVFRREVFDEIEIESPRFFVNTEILAKARRLGLSIHQVGVPHLRRLEGLSKVRWSDVLVTIREISSIGRAIRRIPRREPLLAPRTVIVEPRPE
jgi:glycosyltransferase involved in cell wall biosynthesis